LSGKELLILDPEDVKVEAPESTGPSAGAAPNDRRFVGIRGRRRDAHSRASPVSGGILFRRAGPAQVAPPWAVRGDPSWVERPAAPGPASPAAGGTSWRRAAFGRPPPEAATPCRGKSQGRGTLPLGLHAEGASGGSRRRRLPFGRRQYSAPRGVRKARLKGARATQILRHDLSLPRPEPWYFGGPSSGSPATSTLGTPSPVPVSDDRGHVEGAQHRRVAFVPRARKLTTHFRRRGSPPIEARRLRVASP